MFVFYSMHFEHKFVNVLELWKSLCLFFIVVGDHDAILVLLMVPRIISKAELLATQVREKVG